MRIWGYWATLGWAVLAFFGGQFVALAVVLALHVGSLDVLMANPFDGILVSLFLWISGPATIALLALAVRIRGAPVFEYLALSWPPARQVVIAVVLLVLFIAASDAILFFSGEPLVTPFQVQSYATAKQEGWLIPLFAGAVLMAPASEEVMFRGFLFRGWARTARSAVPAVIVISILWAALHIQYDWTGILQIFLIGLFLGWIRWRSGSTLLTLFLHALFNLEGMLETFARIQFFS